MIAEFLPRSTTTLARRARYDSAPGRPYVYMESPALEVMTDFREVRPVTVAPDVSIDEALEIMKREGVRLLLVIDDAGHVIGVINANSIQGEAPIRIAEDGRLPRSAITVQMLMTPQARLPVLQMMSVVDAQVGHIVATLKHLERHHVLVVDVDESTGAHTVRGLFSSSQIRKQLVRELRDELPAAHSLAEMVHTVEHGVG